MIMNIIEYDLFTTLLNKYEPGGDGWEKEEDFSYRQTVQVANNSVCDLIGLSTAKSSLYLELAQLGMCIVTVGDSNSLLVIYNYRLTPPSYHAGE